MPVRRFHLRCLDMSAPPNTEEWFCIKCDPDGSRNRNSPPANSSPPSPEGVAESKTPPGRSARRCPLRACPLV